jgi:predicted RNA-binding protein
MSGVFKIFITAWVWFLLTQNNFARASSSSDYVEVSLEVKETQYTVEVEVTDNKKKSLKVTMLPENISQNTDAQGKTQFTKISPGEHTLRIQEDRKIIEKNVRVDGENPKIVYNINVNPPNINIVLLALGTAVVLWGTLLSRLLLRLIKK